MLTAVVAAVVSVVLLASGFKVIDLVSRPRDLGPLVASTALVAWELALVWSWLRFGANRWNLYVGRTAFSGFAVVSAAKWLMGQTDCGCFGAVPVHPLISLGVDLALLMLLVATPHKPDRNGEAWPDFLVALGRATAVSAVAVFAVTLAAQTRFVNAESYTQWTEGYEEVALQPARWEGRPCPITNQIVDGERLSFGTWTIVLIRDGCVHCRSLLAALDGQVTENGGIPRNVAIIGTAGLLDDQTVTRLQSRGLFVSCLNPVKDWHVSTPYVVELSDGVCTSTRLLASDAEVHSFASLVNRFRR